jgi:hypothetical protein
VVCWFPSTLPLFTKSKSLVLLNRLHLQAWLRSSGHSRSGIANRKPFQVDSESAGTLHLDVPNSQHLGPLSFKVCLVLLCLEVFLCFFCIVFLALSPPHSTSSFLFWSYFTLRYCINSSHLSRDLDSFLVK